MSQRFNHQYQINAIFLWKILDIIFFALSICLLPALLCFVILFIANPNLMSDIDFSTAQLDGLYIGLMIFPLGIVSAALLIVNITVMLIIQIKVTKFKTLTTIFLIVSLVMACLSLFSLIFFEIEIQNFMVSVLNSESNGDFNNALVCFILAGISCISLVTISSIEFNKIFHHKTKKHIKK
ncbi:MAG: hypothetical protein LBS76_04170 [Mycoplasmataceae bacterium]|jgi:hypothetical protein|nr:hypothetical protein [Mycoplasmataceae bacterium]